MSIDFFIKNSYKISEYITQKYSTSFSLAASLLEKEKREAIYAIYGFVRLADEIVDSFHSFDQAYLLESLNKDLEYVLECKISNNTILLAFSETVRKYNINKSHIQAFMESMRLDLIKQDYSNTEELKEYIYGSADVVGLMCLKVFCNGNETLYKKLEYPAQKLGSAFQKVNFLRDLRNDIQELGRSYFPEIYNNKFDNNSKRLIEESIEKDFKEAWKGLKELPGRSKLSVALAYFYYTGLFNKIKGIPPEEIYLKRIRISNIRKYLIFVKTFMMYKIKLI